MHRFFVPPEGIAGSKARVEGSTARQMAVVLRMAPGDEVLLLVTPVWSTACVWRWWGVERCSVR